LFDCNSGDYWIVSLLGVQLLRLLQANGQMTHDDIAQQIAFTPTDENEASLLQLTVQSLVENSLLQAVN